MDALPRITRESVCALILARSPPRYAIIDVRDDDHIGGHIHTSTHVPSRGLDAQLPALVRSLAEKEVVVFHCALSQQRGPAAAGSYLRERAKGRSAGVNGEKGGDGEKGGVEEVKSEEGVVRGTEGGEDWKGEEGEEGERVKGAVGGQKVYVLDGGFVRWQERYGRDERLTDSFAPDIWVNYY